LAELRDGYRLSGLEEDERPPHDARAVGAEGEPGLGRVDRVVRRPLHTEPYEDLVPGRDPFLRPWRRAHLRLPGNALRAVRLPLERLLRWLQELDVLGPRLGRAGPALALDHAPDRR